MPSEKVAITVWQVEISYKKPTDSWRSNHNFYIAAIVIDDAIAAAREAAKSSGWSDVVVQSARKALGSWRDATFLNAEKKNA